MLKHLQVFLSLITLNIQEYCMSYLGHFEERIP